MSYREENGQVILSMSREDYERLLLCLGAATAPVIACEELPGGLTTMLDFVNRLNEGNPNYTPYQVSAPPRSKE